MAYTVMLAILAKGFYLSIIIIILTNKRNIIAVRCPGSAGRTEKELCVVVPKPPRKELFFYALRGFTVARSSTGITPM